MERTTIQYAGYLATTGTCTTAVSTHLGTDPLKLCNLVSFRTPFTMDRDLARMPSLFDFVPGTASTSNCLSAMDKNGINVCPLAIQ